MAKNKDVKKVPSAKTEVLPPMDKSKIEAIGKAYNELGEAEKIEFLKNTGINLELYKQLVSFSSAIILGVYNGTVAWVQLKTSDVESLGYLEVMKHHLVTKALPENMRGSSSK